MGTLIYLRDQAPRNEEASGLEFERAASALEELLRVMPDDHGLWRACDLLAVALRAQRVPGRRAP